MEVNHDRLTKARFRCLELRLLLKPGVNAMEMRPERDFSPDRKDGPVTGDVKGVHGNRGARGKSLNGAEKIKPGGQNEQRDIDQHSLPLARDAARYALMRRGRHHHSLSKGPKTSGARREGNIPKIARFMASVIG